MKIHFKFQEYYDILDQFYDLFECRYTYWKDEVNDNLLLINDYRIVVPCLGLSFREGEIHIRVSDSPDDDEAYEFECGCALVYEEQEAKLGAFLVYSDVDIEKLLIENCRFSSDIPDEVEKWECYIDTNEFISDEEFKSIFPDLFEEI